MLQNRQEAIAANGFASIDDINQQRPLTNFHGLYKIVHVIL